MYNQIRKENKVIVLFSMLLLASIYGCDFKSKKEEYTTYRAINGKDTAVLSISIDKNRFWGRYEIIYGKMGKDSGEVRGEFIGDTLRGTYKFISFGGSKKQAPIAFLKKNNKLLLGKGVASSLMDMPVYMSDFPIDYNDPEFVFEEINISSKK